MWNLDFCSAWLTNLLPKNLTVCQGVQKENGHSRELAVRLTYGARLQVCLVAQNAIPGIGISKVRGQARRTGPVPHVKPR